MGRFRGPYQFGQGGGPGGWVKGKTWEKKLDCLAQAGYSYGYVSFLDTQTGQTFFLVDAIKGDGPRVAVAKPSMEEAVGELVALLGLG